MTGRAMLRFLPIGLTLALVLAACGGSGKKTVTSTAPGTRTVRVYFLRSGFVQPVARTVVPGPTGVPGTLAALYGGPTRAEQGELGLSTQVPIDNSYLRIAFSGDPRAGLLTFRLPHTTRAELAQLVYTLSQFPASRKLRINGKTYSRADFEDVTPAILVESPLPFTRVSSPLRVSGTANTFEATFQYELKDETGKLLAKHFVTATSGNGVRGTYDVSIPFSVAGPTKVTLTVYEASAENGSRVNQVDIPLTLAP
jgi:hypothetical protein